MGISRVLVLVQSIVFFPLRLVESCVAQALKLFWHARGRSMWFFLCLWFAFSHDGCFFDRGSMWSHSLCKVMCCCCPFLFAEACFRAFQCSTGIFECCSITRGAGLGRCSPWCKQHRSQEQCWKHLQSVFRPWFRQSSRLRSACVGSGGDGTSDGGGASCDEHLHSPSPPLLGMHIGEARNPGPPAVVADLGGLLDDIPFSIRNTFVHIAGAADTGPRGLRRAHTDPADPQTLRIRGPEMFDMS
jgi:hypothetical protein